MSYCPFIDGDTYVFRTVDDRRCCCDCSFGGEPLYETEQAMLDHLAEHQSAGHDGSYDHSDHERGHQTTRTRT